MNSWIIVYGIIVYVVGYVVGYVIGYVVVTKIYDAWKTTKKKINRGKR